MTARLLTILGPKGGVGKSTIASNMLIAARLHGIETAGLDLDSQRSFAGWAETRAAAGREPACMVAEGRVTDWAAELPDAELVIIDTPPGLEGEEHVTALRELALRSDLVLVPALPEGPSLTRLVTVPAELGAIGVAIVFVLNRVVKGRVRLPQARAFLAEHGELCPVESRAASRSTGQPTPARLSPRNPAAAGTRRCWPCGASWRGACNGCGARNPFSCLTCYVANGPSKRARRCRRGVGATRRGEGGARRRCLGRHRGADQGHHERAESAAPLDRSCAGRDA